MELSAVRNKTSAQEASAAPLESLVVPLIAYGYSKYGVSLFTNERTAGNPLVFGTPPAPLAWKDPGI
jgi:hypothetical protein